VNNRNEVKPILDASEDRRCLKVKVNRTYRRDADGEVAVCGSSVTRATEWSSSLCTVLSDVTPASAATQRMRCDDNSRPSSPFISIC